MRRFLNKECRLWLRLIWSMYWPAANPPHPSEWLDWPYIDSSMIPMKEGND